MGVLVEYLRPCTANQTTRLRAELALGRPWSHVLPALATWFAVECSDGHTCLQGSWEEERRGGGGPLHCRMFSSILVFTHQTQRHLPSTLVTTTDVSRHCQVSPGGMAPGLRTTVLVGLVNQKVSMYFKTLNFKIYAAWRKSFSELLSAASLCSVSPRLLPLRDQRPPTSL